MQAPKSMRLPLLVAGIAAVLFSTLAMTIVPSERWFHSSLEGVDGFFAQEQLPETRKVLFSAAPSNIGETRVKARCDKCAVIESMRWLTPVGNSPAIYEITVRLRDGSTRVLSDPSPANWGIGEHMILIGG